MNLEAAYENLNSQIKDNYCIGKASAIRVTRRSMVQMGSQ